MFRGVPPIPLEVWGAGGGWGVYRRGYTICIIYQYIVGTYRNIGYIGKESVTYGEVLLFPVFPDWVVDGGIKKALPKQGHWGD